MTKRGRGPPARGIDRVRSEQATEAIVDGQVHWCRAKVLHVLAGAAVQGVLREVLTELLPEDADLTERLEGALRDSGWLPRRT